MRLVVTVGEGSSKREFSAESHAYADPLGHFDPAWMVPDVTGEGVSASGTVRKLAGELAEHVSEMVLQAEVGPAPKPDWEGTGAPERVR